MVMPYEEEEQTWLNAYEERREIRNAETARRQQDPYYEDPDPEQPSVHDAAVASTEYDDAGINFMDTLMYVASPFMALGDAVLAPIGAPANTGSFLGDVAQNAKVSWKAFSRAMLPEYGQERPEYGARAARQLGIDERWGPALEMVTDPTIVMGLSAAKFFQLGVFFVRIQSGQPFLLNDRPDNGSEDRFVALFFCDDKMFSRYYRSIFCLDFKRKWLVQNLRFFTDQVPGKTHGA